jgi:hypothetical protein
LARKRLLCNGRARLQRQQDEQPGPDFWPVVKLFTPDAGCTWLLTEIDPEDPDIAFGLCDLGFGCPELGSVSLSELEAVRGQLNLPVERDLTRRRHCPSTPTRRGRTVRSERRGRPITTNITVDHRAAFEALTSGDYRNFALFSCFVNGEPATAIVAINQDGDNYAITPLFVSVTPSLTLTDHDGQPVSGEVHQRRLGCA